MTRRVVRAWTLAATVLAAALSGCGGSKEVVLRTAAGAEVTAEEIDDNPLRLLPAGGIGWLHLDVTKTGQTELGRALLADLEARFPLPTAAGFSFQRDVAQLSIASYSMRGVDFAGIASGRFDPERIAAAALEHGAGPLAPPLVKSTYAGRTLFTAQNVGFVVITRQTALFGNEVALRRCLDRIAESRVADDLPAWVADLLATQGAAFSFGLDLTANPLTAVLSHRLAQLRGASMARAVGNFEPPGINLAGTITHADHQAARDSANLLLQAGGSLNIYGRLFGLGQPIRKLETQAVGSDTQLVLAIDGGAVQALMQRFLPPPPRRPDPSGPGWAATQP